MFTLPNIWEFASVLSKFFLFASVASIAGGSFCLLFFYDDRRFTIQQHLTYILVGSLVGFHAVVIYFFLQVGLIKDAGLMGILDPRELTVQGLPAVGMVRATAWVGCARSTRPTR